MLKIILILLTQSALRTYAFLAHFHRIAQDGFDDQYTWDLFQKLSSDHKGHHDRDQTISRLVNRSHRRQLQAMIDNLVLGGGAHAHRHSLHEFEKSTPFAPGRDALVNPAMTRAQKRAARFKMPHARMRYKISGHSHH